MEMFDWNKKLETGLENVDKQHRKLVDLRNALGTLLSIDDVNEEDLKKIVEELIFYTKYHFTEEEKEMSICRVDERHISKHKEIHNGFLENVLNFKKELLSGRGRVSADLFDFLTNWLVYHILGSDMTMARQIEDIKAGMSPEEAYEKEEKSSDAATDLLLLSLNKLFEQVSNRNRELKEFNLNLEQKVLEKTKEIQKREQLFYEILNSTDNIMIITDFKDLKYSNDKFKKTLGTKNSKAFNEFTNHNMLDMFIEAEGYLHRGLLDENSSFEELIEKTPEKDRIVLILNEKFETKAFNISISNLKENNDFLITLSDITTMREQHIKTEKKAYVDGLTQVYNRNKFNEVFEQEMKNMNRCNQPLSIAVVDIDKFKNFNDTYGHLIGDEVLITMARTVNDSIRETDLFARWGGEEFAILFRYTDARSAKTIADKLREKIQENEHPVAGKITASFGITEYKDEDNIESIFKRCDDALYRAKANGRNRVEII